MLTFHYNEVNTILQIIQSYIEKNVWDIEKNLSTIKEQLNEIDLLRAHLIKKRKKDNASLVKRIIYYIAKGLPEQKAIAIASDEFCYWDKEATVIWQDSKKSLKTGTLLFAKRFTAVKMRKKGFKIKEIAGVLEVSENHVYKLLNEDVDIKLK
jgi:hypothetical protein